MKNKLNLLIVILFVAALATCHTFSQVKQDEELTKDEAIIRINEWMSKVQDLKAKIQNLDGDVEKLKIELTETIKKYEDCNKELYAMIGATPEDVEKFRQQIGNFDGRIRDMKRLSDDALADRQEEVKAMEEEFKTLRNNKIALLPEFYNKIIGMYRDVKGLYREKKIKGYTVGTWAQNRDCLWNISGKMEIYGDPLQWPKIWQGNTDKIKNPDLIYQGQVLTIPPAGPKSNDEIKAERKYWRNKRAALEQQTPAQQEKTQKGE
jgi:hypothetical protein